MFQARRYADAAPRAEFARLLRLRLRLNSFLNPLLTLVEALGAHERGRKRVILVDLVKPRRGDNQQAIAAPALHVDRLLFHGANSRFTLVEPLAAAAGLDPVSGRAQPTCGRDREAR